MMSFFELLLLLIDADNQQSSDQRVQIFKWGEN